MAVVHLSPATEEIRTQETHPISVYITPTVQRDYIRRGVFPYIRPGNALTRRLNSAAAVFMSNAEEARALLEDARSARDRFDESPRGTLKAFSSLRAALSKQLAAEARRGLWVDPGLDEAHARQVRASALFEVGDKVLYFASDDEGLSATIVSAYKVFKVGDDSGCYVDEDGRRFSYRSGYAIECEGEKGFSIAGDLTRDDCKPSHLCLVP